MARRARDTGTGEKYSDAEAERVAMAIEAAYADWGREEEPSKGYVHAQVEWAGHIMRTNNGKRITRLDLPAAGMKKVRKAVEKARKASGRKSTAKPAASRKAKGWHAQLNELLADKRGSKAADRAGLDPTRRTVEKWLSRDGGREDFAPSKANRDAIAKAYDELRNWSVTESRDASEAASKEAAEAMTEAMHDQYGVNVRFRDIEEFRFE
ncbi:hypothetical protein [[Kitasatospora] papulosa]|uniref:hypothetical protein n=1 Tax=[Kitasatospora] papulosa TaxID=1464011 RepID=UPI0037227AA4